MRVREQHRQLQRPILEFRHQRPAQRPQPRAGVEEDDFSTGTDFDARRIPAIAHGRRSRRRNRAAHAPEFNISGGFDAKNLTRVWQKTNCKKQPDYRHLAPSQGHEVALAVERRAKGGGLAGTRTLDQCLKRALLYQLSYQPTKIIIHQNWGLNPAPTPKTFGAALPTELPTHQGAEGYQVKTAALSRKVF